MGCVRCNGENLTGREGSKSVLLKLFFQPWQVCSDAYAFAGVEHFAE